MSVNTKMMMAFDWQSFLVAENTTNVIPLTKFFQIVLPHLTLVGNYRFLIVWIFPPDDRLVTPT